MDAPRTEALCAAMEELNEMKALAAALDLAENDVSGYVIFEALAEGIRREMEGCGICARYGGDEFAFAVLTEGETPELEPLRERIIRTANRTSGGKQYAISASLGACSCTVRDHLPIDQLLAEADKALYEDKNSRRR